MSKSYIDGEYYGDYDGEENDEEVEDYEYREETVTAVAQSECFDAYVEDAGQDEEFYEDEFFSESYYEELAEETIREETVVEEIEGDVNIYDNEPDDDVGAATGGMAAMIAAAASKRKKMINNGETKKATEVRKPLPRNKADTSSAAADGGMAAMVAAAANKRNKRIDDGGTKKVTEVKQPLATKKLDTSSMAAMVAQRAKSRNERVEAGGAMKVRAIPEEHKKVFMSVVEEAANVGNLTKMREHAVEAIGTEKEEVDTWGGPTGLRTDNLRSVHFMVINEAAAMGAMRRLKPVETTNYDANAVEEEEELPDVDKLTDEHGRRVVRTEYLLEHALKEERREKKQQWAAENQQSISQYRTIDEVVLPSNRVPDFKPKKTKMSHKESMDAIALAVAERAWERNYRLNRPKANLRMTRSCNCKFCVNPNPFQTHKYKKVHDAGAKDVQEYEALVKEKKKWVWEGLVQEQKDREELAKRNAPPPPDARRLQTTINIQPATERTPRSKPKPIPLSQEPTSQRPRPMQPPPPPPVSELEPEPQEMEQYPVILLDNTVTYGHKRPKPRSKKGKEKIDKDKNKRKKKKQTWEDQGVDKHSCCIIM